MAQQNENYNGNLRYGPMPAFPQQQRYARIVMVLCIAVIAYFNVKNQSTSSRIFASRDILFINKSQTITCSESFRKEIVIFKGCEPAICGRAVFDKIITNEESSALLSIAKRCLSITENEKPEKSASIVDLHSGALSVGTKFVNLYKLPKTYQLLTERDFQTYRKVRKKIQRQVAEHFNINTELLYLTHPTFFSKLTNATAQSIHDEYWHKHVDKETYESFHYTTLLYLNNYGQDFYGGRFVFVETDNSTTIVEPRVGRLSMFTSGAENPHFVERVESGVRYAITVSFTCDHSKAIIDPQLKQ